MKEKNYHGPCCQVAARFASGGTTTIPLYMYLIAETASLNSITCDFDIGVSSGTWKSFLFPSRLYRYRAWLAFFIAPAQQINGAEGVLFYAPTLYERAGVAETKQEQFTLTVTMGLVKVIFIGVSVVVLDSVGRRPCSSSVSLVLVGLGFRRDLEIGVLACGTFAYVAFFSIGFGPVCCWLYASELFPSLRSRGMSLCVLLNRFGASLASCSCLCLLGGQAGLFGLYAAITAGITVVAYLTAIDERKSLGGDFSPKGTQEPWLVGSKCLKVCSQHRKSPDLLTWLGPLWCLHMDSVHGFEPDPQHRKRGIPR
ncbi:PLT6 [Symbiodinium sp. CCMP2592]|nr:PLT6 [Symbiodinium sp. CCMP2592]